MKTLKHSIILVCLSFTILFGISDTLSVSISIMDSIQSSITDNNIPTEFKLYSPHPNPFNPVCNITLDIPKNDIINLTVYDIYGRSIYNIYDGAIIPGKYEFYWNASKVSSGIYFIRIITKGQFATRKVVLLK